MPNKGKISEHLFSFADLTTFIFPYLETIPPHFWGRTVRFQKEHLCPLF